ncbi:MAG: cupin-like domain-containing protein [Polyangiaceae bacterium]
MRLPLDWELWVVEHLLFTASLDDLVDALVDRGVERAAARAQIEAVLASKGFERLRARLAQATLASRMERLQRALLPPVEEIPVREDIDADALHRDHWAPSRPLKLTRCAPTMRAAAWTLAGLRDRFGEAEIRVNVDRTRATRSSEVEDVETGMTLSDFVGRALSAATDDLYVVSRNGLLGLPALAPLWDDFDPLPAFLVPPTRPRGVSLWAGPAGTITRPHFDPHNVLLFQIEGHKRVRLAPRIQPEAAARYDAY